MIIQVFADTQKLSGAAAADAAEAILSAIARRGLARVVAATGKSQVAFLEALTRKSEIDWKKVELFQLDEYIGLPTTHPASLTKYINEHLARKVGISRYHFLDGSQDPAEVIRRTGEAIRTAPIDVAFVGLGENGHLAFNDPPADFEADDPYITVNLQEASRRQQVREGWFGDISSVPKRAISMSVRQILRAAEILAIVPEQRKAEAVKACFEGAIRPEAPASILQTHPNATVYLDRESASLLNAATLRKFESGQEGKKGEAESKSIAG